MRREGKNALERLSGRVEPWGHVAQNQRDSMARKESLSKRRETLRNTFTSCRFLLFYSCTVCIRKFVSHEGGFSIGGFGTTDPSSTAGESPNWSVFRWKTKCQICGLYQSGKMTKSNCGWYARRNGTFYGKQTFAETEVNPTNFLISEDQELLLPP